MNIPTDVVGSIVNGLFDMAKLSVEERQNMNDAAHGFVNAVLHPDDDTYDAALMKWGIDAQLGIAVEECAEFIVASSKRIRAIANEDHEAEGKALDMMREECADALITLEQARRILGPYEVDRWKVRKLSRLRDRLED